MNSSQVGVFKEGDEVGLGSLLERHDGGRLEAEIGLDDMGNIVRKGGTEHHWRTITDLEILCDFTDETLERELPDQELG